MLLLIHYYYMSMNEIASPDLCQCFTVVLHFKSILLMISSFTDPNCILLFVTLSHYCYHILSKLLL